jgi:threonylcarbamoyladenosine tRNA methylthiotransferase MtaB
VLQEISRLGKIGVNEIVLTGIHLGHYGGDLDPGTSLESLLEGILSGCSIPRIRLSSVEPLELEDALLGRMAHSERICAHLHVPLQSGDDEILRRMNRPYLSSQYKERVLQAQNMIKDLTLGCDVIVGFPGETRKHFDNSVDFLQEIPFSYLHVFPFSPRPGTPACHFGDRVSIRETKERSRILREISRKRRETMMWSYVGRCLTVLVERAWKGEVGWMEGLTGNYMRVRFPGGQELQNRIIPIDLKRVEAPYLVGTRAC